MKLAWTLEMGAAVMAAAAILGSGAARADEADRPWTLAISGGTGFFNTPAPYAGIELTRQLGKSFVSARIGYSSSAEADDPAARSNLPRPVPEKCDAVFATERV